ncbi:hypothetical protein ACHAW6_012878 [Cyclotella cf. meneghiniana]
MLQTFLIVVFAVAATSTTEAFTAFSAFSRTPPKTSPTVLNGSNRRGKLGNNIALNEDGQISKIMTKKEKQKLGNSKMRRGKKEQVMEISPLLAEWAKTESDTASDGTGSTVSSLDAATVFASFDDDGGAVKLAGSRGKQRKKTNASPSITSANSAKINEILESIELILSTPNCDVPQLLSCITSLVDADGSTHLVLPNLKSILSKRPSSKDEKQPSYRLAWAGSDASICHIGTSLHKVPLARLQEIYLCLGYNRWELLEVIRILGPFPNVRNTLRGEVKVAKRKGTGFASGGDGGGVGVLLDSAGREAIRMTIAYNSMIDGTGKEILAGKQDNVKYVMLDVWFANEKAIVCTIVPTEEEEGEAMSDPLTSRSGEMVLLFVAEENLEEELEKLRAA